MAWCEHQGCGQWRDNSEPGDEPTIVLRSAVHGPRHCPQAGPAALPTLLSKAFYNLEASLRASFQISIIAGSIAKISKHIGQRSLPPRGCRHLPRCPHRREPFPSANDHRFPHVGADICHDARVGENHSSTMAQPRTQRSTRAELPHGQ